MYLMTPFRKKPAAIGCHAFAAAWQDRTPGYIPRTVAQVAQPADRRWLGSRRKDTCGNKFRPQLDGIRCIQSEDAGALVDYQAAFRINPQAATAEIIRMLILNFQEDGDQVFENCRKHLRIYPDDIVAYARRGLTLLLQGQETEAEPDLEQALRRSPAWKEHLQLLIDTARRCRDH